MVSVQVGNRSADLIRLLQELTRVWLWGTGHIGWTVEPPFVFLWVRDVLKTRVHKQQDLPGSVPPCICKWPGF